LRYIQDMSATAPCFCQLCCPDWSELDRDQQFVPHPEASEEKSAPQRRASEALEKEPARLAGLDRTMLRPNARN